MLYKDLEKVVDKDIRQENKTLLIALEGVDCSGKTTYLNALNDNSNFNILKVSINEFIDSKFKEGATYFRNNLLYSSFCVAIPNYVNLFSLFVKEVVLPAYTSGIYDFIIFDRFLLSTFIYQECYKESNFKLLSDVYKESCLNKVPTPLNVVLDPGIEVIKQRLSNKVKDIKESQIEDSIERITQLYTQNANEIISQGVLKSNSVVLNKSTNLDMPLESEFLEYLKSKYLRCK